MSSISKLTCHVGGLDLTSPLVIASGIWPYEKEYWAGEYLDFAGAVCSKAITADPRPGNPGTRVWETPCGMLNSIGLQNEGAGSFFGGTLGRLRSYGKPLLLNVSMESSSDLERILDAMEPVAPSVDCVELNVSCPNVDQGCMSWGVDPALTAQAVQQVRRRWSGPLWVKLTPQAPDPCAVAKAAQDAGASALVVANTWLGAAIDTVKARPAFDRVVAGLSGPAIFPLALRMVWQVCGAVDIPVVGCGGVASADSAVAMLMAGAAAVEVGIALFSDFSVLERIARGLEEEVSRRGFQSVGELVGLARPDRDLQERMRR